MIPLVQFDDSTSKTGVCEKNGRVECGAALIIDQHGTSFVAVRKRYLRHIGRSNATKEVLQEVTSRAFRAA